MPDPAFPTLSHGATVNGRITYLSADLPSAPPCTRAASLPGLARCCSRPKPSSRCTAGPAGTAGRSGA